jgi:ectoine hydroxylase-related dioxygenase (phytanoyl-CoA dioxygenase family)
MQETIVKTAAPYDAAQIEQFKHDFNRDGFLLMPGVLQPPEIAALKAGIDRIFADEHWKDTENAYSDFVAVRLFETDPVFEEMLTREPIIGLVENILGPDCHLIAQNAVRNAPGQAIDFYHADDTVIFPVAEGMERHDARLTMPVFILTVQILLTDVPSLEYGPTQYVPGSHYSGRQPDDRQNPNFEGREPVSIFAKAGDIYLHNGQCWHRGAPNTSDRTRYLFQMAYGQRWVSQRFYPFLNYQMPQYVLERADERRRRVLGAHPKGAYG